MKIALRLTRWTVGLLFVFSGLVKANDPLGLSYKIQEFFEVWKWNGLEAYTLGMSLTLNFFEIVAGVALLTGFAYRYISWSLLFLTLIFTGLTGYTFFTGSPTNCGCFGDCLPLSAGFSFAKDIFLTLLIIGLLLVRKSPFRSVPVALARIPVMVAAGVAAGLQVYALRYLPPIDCLPYREGVSISEGIKNPTVFDADTYLIEFTYRKNGKEIRFSENEFPADFSAQYTFVKRERKLISKGIYNEAPIKEFNLRTLSGTDTTLALLNMETAVWVWVSSLNQFEEFNSDLQDLIASAGKKGIPVYCMSVNAREMSRQLARNGLGDLPVYTCSSLAVKTAARVNPTIMLVHRGVILKKRGLPQWESVIEQ